MTVTYTSEVADSKGFGCFLKLLFRWKGGIYKLVWRDLLLYSICYYALSITYRFGLSESGKKVFEDISLYTQYFMDLIPMAFILGFYVSIVMQRWWAQYEKLPWPDSLSLYISTFLFGNDDKGRMMRRTIVRYANLCFTLTLIMISPKVKKRFPSLDHLIEAGLLTANEKKIIEDTASKTPHPYYWMPLVWAGTIVSRARKEGRIRDDFAVKTIIDELNRLRGLCGSLLGYDWISIPLVYTQVVTLAVYTFFLASLMGRQFLDTTKNYEKMHTDLYVPVFTYLQLFFYMGWMKVAETLVNPFGEDDDDFEVNWLIDRNVQVAYLIVDEMHNEHPELIQDIYWDEVFPQELPYTIAAQEFRTEPPMGSTANMEVPLADQEILPMVEEEEEEECQEGEESLIEQGRGTPPGSKEANMKRIGSSFSNIMGGLHPKGSFISYLSRTASTASRRPLTKKTLSRISSRASTNPASRKERDYEHTSDGSFSESDDHNISSSQESLRKSAAPRKKVRKLGRLKSVDEDGAIIINIKRPGKEAQTVVISESNADIVSPTEAEFQMTSPQQTDLKSSESSASIKTSIFKNENADYEGTPYSQEPENRKRSIPTIRIPQIVTQSEPSMIPRRPSKEILRSIPSPVPLEDIPEVADDATLSPVLCDDPHLPTSFSSEVKIPIGPQLLGLSSSRPSDSGVQGHLTSDGDSRQPYSRSTQIQLSEDDSLVPTSGTGQGVKDSDETIPLTKSSITTRQRLEPSLVPVSAEGCTLSSSTLEKQSDKPLQTTGYYFV